jgi:two-component system, sensor histidine kinase RegB
MIRSDVGGTAPARNNLQRLILLRYVLAATAACGIVAVYVWRPPLVGVAPVIWIIAILVAINMITQWRLRKRSAVGNAELFVQLLADLALWSVLLAWSGAPHSPLGSMYLLPVVIAAVTLPRWQTWCIALLSVACYSYLYYRYAHGLDHDPAFAEGLDLHVLGMWATFVFSALLIAFFLERMATAVRERDRLLATMREEELRNERIVALGTMAVGAAHELGTPLTTMAVVAGELQAECKHQPEMLADVQTLRAQIDVCKRIISDLLLSAGHARAEAAGSLRIDQYLDELIVKWQQMRPAVECSYARRGVSPVPAVLAEQTVSQAIMNLLNNAADASPHNVQIDGEWSEDNLRLEIRDRGGGLTREAKLRMGEPFFSTKPPGQGIGIGLFLANATIERYGGKVGIFDREGGGACTLVELPLARLLGGAAR